MILPFEGIECTALWEEEGVGRGATATFTNCFNTLLSYGPEGPRSEIDICREGRELPANTWADTWGDWVAMGGVERRSLSRSGVECN